MRVEYTFDVVGYGECRIRTAGIDEPSPVADEDHCRLHNLGYPAVAPADFEHAVLRFQRDYAAAQEGLVDNQVPSATRVKLDAIYNADCDASRPTPTEEPTVTDEAREKAPPMMLECDSIADLEWTPTRGVARYQVE